ncbi:MAG: CRTAC1 family protein [Deltaproteobacteria bacterium]|nr:CRTAC1 family protein [Deltaproteobacteria bacterium]
MRAAFALVPVISAWTAACATPAATPAAATADVVSPDSTSGDAAAPDSAVDSAAADTSDPWAGAPADTCKPGKPWDGKGPAWIDRTEKAGLSALGVVGIRLSTADLDGDLRPELFARSMAGQGNRENWEAGKRRIFLLKAKAADGGGLQFDDITLASGVLATRDGQQGRQAHVVVYGDVDNDGDLDAFAGNTVPGDPKKDLFPGDASEVLINDGTGVFTLPADNLFASKELRRSVSSASFVDFDRDGALDLWLGYTSWPGAGGDLPIQDQLLRGDGKGGWQIVTGQEGLQTKDWKLQAEVEAGTVHRVTWGTAACDVNGDGDPDLLGVSYGRYFNSLWLNGGKGPGGKRFEDLKAETHFDRDDDDDWTTNWNAQCYCQENPQAAECDKAPKPVVNCAQLKKAFGGTYRWNHANDRKPFRLGGNTGTVQCADLDRDGDLDMVFGSIVHPDVGSSSDPMRIASNDGAPIPQFVTHKGKDNGFAHTWPTGQAQDVGDMSLAVFDFDNDGRLDIAVAGSDYPGTRAKLWQQQPDGRYLEVTAVSGLEMMHAASIAVADWDLDGDLDVAFGHSLARCGLSPAECKKTEEVHVFENTVGNSANWLRIALQGGAGSNRRAIGARVSVTAGGSTQTQEVGGGYGHFGLQNDTVLHFGLGAGCVIDKVLVRWPDAAGTVQTWTHVRANQLVRLVQGEVAPQYPLYKN